MAAFPSTILRTRTPRDATLSLGLRIHQAGGSVRDVAVSDAKCTIGSGPRCTVRLCQEGVQPLHCLIYGTPTGVGIRRWSTGTLLNGLVFDDAALAGGDCLQIGPVEIEVVSIGCQPDPAKVEAESDRPDPIDNSNSACRGELLSAAPAQVANTVTDTDANISPAAEEVFRQLRAANESSRRRNRRLLSALREDRRQRSELQSQLDELQQQLAVLSDQRREAESTAPPKATQCEPAEDVPVAGSEVSVDDAETAAEAERPDVAVALLDEDDELAAAPAADTPPQTSDVSRTTMIPGVGKVAKKLEGESYSALLADRINRIEQLERQLGIVADREDSPEAADDESAVLARDDSPASPAESPLAAEVPLPAQLEVEPTDKRADTPLDELATAQATDVANMDHESAVAASMAEAPSVEPPLQVEPVKQVEVEPPSPPAEGGAESAVDEEKAEGLDSAASTAGRESSEAPGLSTDASSFWGFSDPACGVDADLLGPAALSARRYRPTNKSLLDENLLHGETRSEAEATSPQITQQPPPDENEAPESAAPASQQLPGTDTDVIESVDDVPVGAETTSADETAPDVAPAALDESPPKGELPGASAPAIPGLSDSAWAHLRELSIWHEDSAEGPEAADEEMEPSADSAEVASDAVPVAGPTETAPAVEDRSRLAGTDPTESEAWERTNDACPAANVPDVAAPDLTAAEVPLKDDSPSSFEADPPNLDSLPEELAPAATVTDPPANLAEESAPARFEPVEDPTPSSPVLSTAFDRAPAPAADGSASDGSAPNSFIDRYAHLFDDDDPSEAVRSGTELAEESVTPDVIVPPTVAESMPSADSAGGTDGDQDSIDDYMAQLMQRIRGRSSGSDPSLTWVAPTEESSQSSAAAGKPGSVSNALTDTMAAADAAADADTVAAADVAEALPLTLEEMKKSGPRPEQSTDMNALRDLANQSARSAIGAHASRRHREHAVSKLLVVGAAVAAGMYLLATAPNLASLQFGGACLAVLASLYWGTVIMRALSEAARERSAAENASADRTDYRSQLPIDGPDTNHVVVAE